MTDHPGPAGRGAALLAAVRTADDKITAIRAEYDKLTQTERHAWLQPDGPLGRAYDERSAAGMALYAYFEGPEATAAERAAWELLDPARWRGPQR